MDTCQSNVTATTAVTFCRFMPMRQPAKLQSHTSRYQRKRKWLRESYAWWWGHCGGWDVLVQLSNLLTSQWHNMPMTSDILRTNCRRRLARPNKQCEHHLTLVNSTLWLVFVDLKKTSDSFLFSLHLTLMVSTNQRDYWKSNQKKRKTVQKFHWNVFSCWQRQTKFDRTEFDHHKSTRLRLEGGGGGKSEASNISTRTLP